MVILVTLRVRMAECWSKSFGGMGLLPCVRELFSLSCDRPSKIAPVDPQGMFSIIHDPATEPLRKAAAQLASTRGPAVACSTNQRNLVHLQEVLR